jgi:DHA1 family tetracycline resistance protein-like MFS transporter
MKVPGVVAAAAHTLEVGQGKAASSNNDAPPPPVGLRRLWLLVLVQLFPFALGVVALPALLLDACGGSEHEAATYVTLGNSLFFGLQWACAGAWGGFSDRAGRRPLLLVGVASDALGAAVLATAPLGALPRVYVALAAFRGVFSQSRIALFAAIADVSESSALAKNYGAFGVAFGLCFVLGPGVGAVLYTASRRLPFVVSFALTLAAWALAFALPETLAGGAKRKAASWNPVAPVSAVCAAPLVAATLPSFVLVSVATSTYALSVFLLTKRFGASTTVVGVFLSSGPTVSRRRPRPRGFAAMGMDSVIA